VQLVVFDLEYGQPAATTGLGTSRPPFRDILGCFGHEAAGLTSSQAGIDSLFCSHQVCFNYCRALHSVSEFVCPSRSRSAQS